MLLTDISNQEKFNHEAHQEVTKRAKEIKNFVTFVHTPCTLWLEWFDYFVLYPITDPKKTLCPLSYSVPSVVNTRVQIHSYTPQLLQHTQQIPYKIDHSLK